MDQLLTQRTFLSRQWGIRGDTDAAQKALSVFDRQEVILPEEPADSVRSSRYKPHPMYMNIFRIMKNIRPIKRDPSAYKVKHTSVFIHLRLSEETVTRFAVLRDAIDMDWRIEDKF